MSCIKWVAIMLVVIFLLLGVPLITYYQVVKPKHPIFTVNQASITGFNLTADNSFLTSFFDIQIRAHNPNHMLKLKYGRMRISVYKHKQELGTDVLPQFNQRKGNVTVLRAQPAALNVSLEEGPAFDFGFERGMGYLNFDVFVTGNLNGKKLEVICKHVVVNISDFSCFNSSQNHRARPCGVLVYTDG